MIPWVLGHLCFSECNSKFFYKGIESISKSWQSKVMRQGLHVCRLATWIFTKMSLIDLSEILLSKSKGWFIPDISVVYDLCSSIVLNLGKFYFLLGIAIGNKLTFRSYLKNICKKLNVLVRITNFRSPQRKTLVNSLITSQIFLRPFSLNVSI